MARRRIARSSIANMQNAETLLLAALFAITGLHRVAPTTPGYDTSTLAYNPYLVPISKSKDMIGMP